MAFDGITVANVVYELRTKLIGGRVYKIAQPEKDELILTIKTTNGQSRLLLSADASLPFIYLTPENKKSPITAPNFCMLLRKHLQNARVLDVTQPGLERAVFITLEHLDELGDLCKKTLVIEIMGKHSNIILIDAENKIIDSIKHVSALVSSVREVLPGKEYFIPCTTDKKDPLETRQNEFTERITKISRPLFKAIYMSFTGLSPLVAQEICYRAGLDGDLASSALTESQMYSLFTTFNDVMSIIKSNEFQPYYIYESGKLKDYCCFYFNSRNVKDLVKEEEGISALLEHFYAEKNIMTRNSQRSSDLRKIVQNALERTIKKMDLQKKQIEDTKDRDIYRIYGELLNTYGYHVEQGSKSIKVSNYYSGEDIMIPLDEMLSAKENAKKYFDKYSKLKRTHEALLLQIEETEREVSYLLGMKTFLQIASSEDDLLQLKEELSTNGYIRKHVTDKKKKVHSKPYHFVTKDGYDIYAGKNNIQNEELSFKFATGNDWWFHAKGIPGSHVIVKAPADRVNEEVPDHVFETAASVAAHFSANGIQDKTEVDYTQKKNLKKPTGNHPGLVIYHTNYSILVSTDISGLDQK